jgi:hypothetical protein
MMAWNEVQDDAPINNVDNIAILSQISLETVSNRLGKSSDLSIQTKKQFGKLENFSTSNTKNKYSSMRVIQKWDIIIDANSFFRTEFPTHPNPVAVLKQS